MAEQSFPTLPAWPSNNLLLQQTTASVSMAEFFLPCQHGQVTICSCNRQLSLTTTETIFYTSNGIEVQSVALHWFSLTT